MKYLILTLLLSQTLNAKSFQGTYEVPVNDSDLKTAALFDLQRIKITQTENTMNLKYTIPAELTGVRKYEVTFSGPFENGHGVLTAAEHQMDCTLTSSANEEKNLDCKVEYVNLMINNENAKKIMAAKFKDQELDKRLLVQQGFSTDPVGIIHLKLK